MKDKKLKFTFVIIDRKYENKFIKFLKNHGFEKYFLFFAKGSASSDILDYLGIGETEKVILVYPSNESDAKKLFEVIETSEYLKHAIAFRSPIKGISSKKSLDYFLKEVISNE